MPSGLIFALIFLDFRFKLRHNKDTLIYYAQPLKHKHFTSRKTKKRVRLYKKFAKSAPKSSGI